jgi:hypothetical protein
MIYNYIHNVICSSINWSQKVLIESFRFFPQASLQNTSMYWDYQLATKVVLRCLKEVVLAFLQGLQLKTETDVRQA